MRKILILALMVSTATTPVLAQRGERSPRSEARSESRGGDSGWRGNRGNGGDVRTPRAERTPQVSSEPRPQPTRTAPERTFRQDRPSMSGGDQGWRGNRGDRGDRIVRGERPPPAVRPQTPPSARPDRGMDGRGWGQRDTVGTPRGDRQPGVRPDRGRDDRSQARNGRDDRRNWGSRPGSDIRDNRWNGRNDTRNYRPDRGNDRRWQGSNRWNRDWRNDRRYDWRGYRTQYRHIYRAPRYYGPSGWHYGYQRFSIGLYLNSLLFSSNYWLNDPWQYRLPPAEYGTRWVRYYNDVLLVDIDSGEVVDVIYDFFY